MRSESEILQALLSWAANEGNVQAIILNGSRGDPDRKPDALSDYDIAVIVRDVDPIRTGDWIGRFGEVMVQWPLRPQPTFDDAWITQLVLYTDGIRIDFQFTTPDAKQIERPGPFHCALFDRNQLTEHIAGAPVAGTTIDPPSVEEFIDRVNAFWWDVPYVIKALQRDELDYARYVMEGDLRWNKLHPLIRWYIGAVYGAHTDVGIFGRWFKNYLPPEIWERYLETFAGADREDQKRAMFAICEFVGIIGRDIATRYEFEYPEATESAVSTYLRKLSSPEGLPRSE